MKQEDKQYEKWLTEIKNRQPILENPEELTTAILNSISGSSSRHKRKKYLLGAWLSGIAAAILLFLFINDTYFSPIPRQIEKQNGNLPNSSIITLPDNWKEMKLSEKNSYLSARYVQHRKLRQASIYKYIKDNRLK